MELKDLAEAAVGLAVFRAAVQQPLSRGRGRDPGGPQRPPARRARVLGPAGGTRSPRPRRAPRAPSARRGLGVRVDAARDMTWYVEQGEPLHPVVQLALEETEETSVGDGRGGGLQAADGRTLKELRAGDGDRHVRARRCNADPAGSTGRARGSPSRSGDRLISVGPEEGEEELAALTRAPGPRARASGPGRCRSVLVRSRGLA